MLPTDIADLVYDPVAHATTCGGQPVPHVTEILAATGLTTDFEALAARGGRIAEMLAHARARGTAVHADCHAYDDDDLDWAKVDPRIAPFVHAWAACRTALGLRPIAHARERQVFHPFEWYTGIQDGVFIDYAGVVVLGDIKTGDPEDAAAHLQTAAYAGAWDLAHPESRIQRRVAIWLVPQRRIPYRVIDYSAWPDAHEHLPVFLAAKCVYNNQPGRRRTA